MGDNRYDYSAPIRLARVLDRVPDLRCIGAHFGGYRRWREAERVLRGADLYFDTSSSLPYLGKEEALEIIHVYGVDRMFFGTDFPMWDPKEELDRFLALDLPVEEAEKILYGNFAAFFRPFRGVKLAGRVCGIRRIPDRTHRRKGQCVPAVCAARLPEVRPEFFHSRNDNRM